MAKYIYGWRPDKPDHRDYLFKAETDVGSLPASVDLRPHCPPVMDQGQLGSCTAHGITGALRYNRIVEGDADLALCRLQLYYDERSIEGTVRSDAGAEIRDGIKVAASHGVAPESMWPYDIAKFKTKPSKAVYAAALKEKALVYERVNVDPVAIKTALAAGFPVVIGISVYQSFEGPDVAKTGIVPMPGKDEQLLGGHCVYVVGYGQKPGTFTIRNSWGEGWGDKGDCYIPEGYIGNPQLGDDYWVIKQVTK